MKGVWTTIHVSHEVGLTDADHPSRHLRGEKQTLLFVRTFSSEDSLVSSVLFLSFVLFFGFFFFFN